MAASEAVIVAAAIPAALVIKFAIKGTGGFFGAGTCWVPAVWVHMTVPSKSRITTIHTGVPLSLP